MDFDPTELTAKENYKLLIGSVIPRPIAFITSMDKEGVVNAAPFSFFTVASSDPPQLVVAVQHQKGERKDTARNILETKEYVIQIVSRDITHDVNETAAPLPPGESELSRTNLTLADSDVVGVPGIREAKIRFEMRLTDHLALASSDLLVGKVVRYHIDDELVSDHRIDAKALEPVSRLAGHDYGTIGEVFTIPRPMK